jgi:hypothetical protein
MNDAAFSLLAALGMAAVGAAAVICWKRISLLPLRWVWMGAGLWALAVVLKLGCALSVNQKVVVFLASMHSQLLLLAGGGLFLGLESSFFEIGLTIAAVWKWRQLGRDAPRAIGIGVGAGAVEALLMGLVTLVLAAISLSGTPEGMEMAEQTRNLREATPLFWLLPPVERLLALLGHAASRSLVLLGVAHRRPAMVFWGWLMFALVDGVAGVFLLTGKMDHISMWWVELAVLPFALVSVPILRWCWVNWPATEKNHPPRESVGIAGGT